MAELPQGWSKPHASRKWHYFEENEIVSICGRWAYASDDRSDNFHDSEDNCKKCKQKRAKIINRKKEK